MRENCKNCGKVIEGEDDDGNYTSATTLDNVCKCRY